MQFPVCTKYLKTECILKYRLLSILRRLYHQQFLPQPVETSSMSIGNVSTLVIRKQAGITLISLNYRQDYIDSIHLYIAPPYEHIFKLKITS